jgi:hypothetical protein
MRASRREVTGRRAGAASSFGRIREPAEVIPWLRALGCNAETARRAAARCAGRVAAPLEKRVNVAEQGLGPPCKRQLPHVASVPA